MMYRRQGVHRGYIYYVFRRYRYTAYRNLVAWAWGKVGYQQRFPLPACVVSAIRRKFPDPEQHYVGFKQINN